MPNFYLIYGTDNSIIKNEVKKIEEKSAIKDIIKYQMSSSLISDVIEDAQTISMFSSKKIIILEDCYFLTAGKNSDDLELLEQYLTKYNPDTYLILICNTQKLDTRKKIYKLLKSTGKIIECKKGDNTYLLNYINKQVTDNNYSIEEAQYLLKNTGSNLDNINHELEKLFMYKFEDKKITNQDIDKIVIKNMEDEIFDLTDAIILHNTKKSLALLNEFVNRNYDEIQIIMLIASQFRFLFQVKRLLNKNKNYSEIAKILEVNPYRVKFSIKKLYTYTEAELLKYIKRLAKIDHDIKLGIMDKRLALELFIIESGMQ